MAAVVSIDSSSSVMLVLASSATPRPDAVVLVVSARRPLGRLEWTITVLVDSARALLVAARTLALLEMGISSNAPSSGAEEVELRLRPLAERNIRATLPLLRGTSSFGAAAEETSVVDLRGEVLSLSEGDRIMRSSYRYPGHQPSRSVTQTAVAVMRVLSD